MKTGDRVYYIVSGRSIRPAVVRRTNDRSCVLAHSSGAICLPASRVYESKEEAEKHLLPRSAPETDPRGCPSAYMKRKLAYDCCGKPDP